MRGNMVHWRAGLFLLPCGVFSASSPMKTSNSNVIRRRRVEDVADFEYDLSDFSIRFEKCQYVKMWDDEMAEDEDAETVFATENFVVYNLCPSDACDDTCESGVHGEYVTDIEDYLQSTVEYQKELLEATCENCNDWCDNDGESCTGCGKFCYQYDNLEANGYIDATEYLECQKVELPENDEGDANQNQGQEQEEAEGEGDEDKNQQEGEEGEENNKDNEEGDQGGRRRRHRRAEEENIVYVGPKCSSDGKGIEIGVFYDEDCHEPHESVGIEDALGAKLSYIILDNVYAGNNEGEACQSCKEQNNNNNNNNNNNGDVDDVNEMCEQLYATSAKCESKYGLEDGFIDKNRQDGDYENQVENEFMVCNYIKNLIYNSYTETGEINIEDDQDEIIREVTRNQKLALVGVLLLVVSMGCYGYHLDNKYEKKYGKKGQPDLASQGGEFT